jgi:hypothetical protein
VRLVRAPPASRQASVACCLCQQPANPTDCVCFCLLSCLPAASPAHLPTHSWLPSRFAKTDERYGTNVADASRQQRQQQRRRPVLTMLGPVRPKPLPWLPQPLGGQRTLLSNTTSSNGAPSNDVWLAAAASGPQAAAPSDAQAAGVTSQDVIAAGVEEPEEDEPGDSSPLEALPGSNAADAAAATTAGLTRRRGRRPEQDSNGDTSSHGAAAADDDLDWKEPKAVRCSGQCRAGLCRIEVDRQVRSPRLQGFGRLVMLAPLCGGLTPAHAPAPRTPRAAATCGRRTGGGRATQTPRRTGTPAA